MHSCDVPGEETNTSDNSRLVKLKQISFFSDTPVNELSRIAEIVSEKQYNTGDIIIEENSNAESFFIIHRGKIQISKEFEDGEEFVLAVYSDGGFFGEMAILDEGPRSATARAVEPTTVLKVSSEDFEQLLYAAPQIAYAIMKELSTRLRETGALLVWQLTRKNRELADAYLGTVRTIVQAIEERDPYLAGHSNRVALVSAAIGRQMELHDHDIHRLELGGLLHDLGMIGLSSLLVNKPGRFDKVEYDEVKRHAEDGKRLIEDVPYLHQAVPHVLFHHERYDGSGYPESLRGGDIPLAGRIIAVADVFDALISDRPHRERLTIADAVRTIRDKSGSDFDPDVVAAFVALSKSPGFPQSII